MLHDNLLEQLNPPQKTAVTAPLQNMLVLAGAGSGKTRVLVHRIAWLLTEENFSPYDICAVTFTNKAAGEMRARIEALLGIPTQGMWVGTFHGLAHRLLRKHWQEADLPETFQVIDSDDQLRMVKRIMRSLGIDSDSVTPKEVTWYINGHKDAGRRADKVGQAKNPHEKMLQRIYQTYEQNCQQAGLVDFAELLLRAYELWINQPQVLQHYQQRFRSILVDEFQDTNAIQYGWLKMLAGGGSSVMIVGDDDQSIYGWRGAKIENIHHFTRDFPNVQTIRLEQNYRSTDTILSAANALIENNESRLGKNLWTDGDKGEPVSVYAAFNEIDEARFAVGQIKKWFDQGGRYDETAILYRSNAQSRVLEEALMQAGMPYRVYGGMRFFERAEIKDALSYLRLLHGRQDDAAFERVINTPTRGIGERTVQHLRLTARERQMSLWDAALVTLSEKMLPTRALQSLEAFINLINQADTQTHKLDLDEQVEHVIHASGLQRHYELQRGEKAQTKLENLGELVTAAKQFEADPEEELSPLAAFLAHAVLESGEQQAAQYQDCVQLMTLHAVKGLEFPLVFLTGVEEGLFPHPMGYDEPGRLEEERRLCYVGITRAMKKLFLTYAERRRLYGKEMYHRPSRFIGEIPEELLEEVRMKARISRPVAKKKFPQMVSTAINESGYKLGQRVSHTSFGEGTVVNCEGSGAHARVQVNFDDHGPKWLVTSFAKLEKV